MAELHITGQLVSAGEFPHGSIFCKWSVDAGPNFRLLQGQSSGQTQCDMPPEGEPALLSHPLDLHYAVKGIDGWPRLALEVYGVDAYGRVELAGYGCCIVPVSPGTHELTCATWKPCGSRREQVASARRRLSTLPCRSGRRTRLRVRARRCLFDHRPAVSQAFSSVVALASSTKR